MMIDINPDLAEICGIHAGDGYMRFRESNKGEVDISGSFEEKSYYDNHVIPLFNRSFNLDIKGKFFRRKTYGFVCYKNEVRDFLFEAGFPSGKKSFSLNVPRSILYSKDKLVLGKFLRGLFDTDGNIYFRKSGRNLSVFKTTYNHYPVLSITSVSKSLAEGIVNILNNFDLTFCYFSQNQTKSGELRIHKIVISGIKGLDQWMNLVGMKNDVKLSRYLVWRKFGFCPPNLTLQQRQSILKGSLDPYSIGS